PTERTGAGGRAGSDAGIAGPPGRAIAMAHAGASGVPCAAGSHSLELSRPQGRRCHEACARARPGWSAGRARRRTCPYSWRAGGRRLADDEVEDGAHGAADVLDAKRLADDRGASLPDELSHVPAQRAGGGKNEPVTELRVMLLDPPVETDAVEPRHLHVTGDR